MARSIIQEAEFAQADRICFLADDNLVFSPPVLESVQSVLDERTPEKYKLQRLEGARWVNASGYTSLDAAGTLIDDIRSGAMQEILESNPDDLRTAAAREPRRFLAALRWLNRGVSTQLRETFSSAVSVPARTAFQHIDGAVNSPYTQYLAASMDLLATLTDYTITGLLDGTETISAMTAIANRVDANPYMFQNEAARIAVAVTRGKVVSIASRHDAALEFKTVRELDGADLIRDLYADMGVWTYFDAPEIDGNAAKFAMSIQESMIAAEAGPPGNRLAVAMSVDPDFLRIYAPVIFHYAQQMPDVDHNIILCGESATVQEVINDVETFRSSLAQVNRSGRPDNIRYYQMPVPADIAEPRTFYASARFFAIQALLEEYASVYVMDADLSTGEDPRPYYKRAAQISFAVPRGRGLEALSPWRRFMAGDLAVNRSALSTPIVEDMQLYIAQGLKQPNSWMLDQNAITYAVERNGDAFGSIENLGRPFTQLRFRTVWERSYLRGSAWLDQT